MKFQLPWTVCRVCLQKGQMFPIFEKDRSGMTIAEKLGIVADVKIVPDKKLPQEICRRCMILLNSAHQFQIQCKKSEFLFQMSVKHKGKLNRGAKQHAVILTLNNGKIYTMPKDVTVKTKSSLLNVEVSSEEIREIAKDRVQMVDNRKVEGKSLDHGKRGVCNANLDNILEEKKPGSKHRPSRRLNLSENAEKYIPCATKTQLNTIPLEIVEANQSKVEEFNHRNLERRLQISENISLGRLPAYSFTKIANPDEDDSSLRDAQTVSPPPQNEIPTKSKRRLRSETAEPQPKSKLFICEICANQYKSKTGFDLHMRVHRNDKPYGCEICSAKFVQSSKLTAHMRSHTGEKPYECRFCSRKFAKKESQSLHERMHTGEKPYECNVCQKKFSYGSVLARHKVLHSNDEKSFICEICEKRFRFKYHLVAHMKTASHQCPQKRS